MKVTRVVVRFEGSPEELKEVAPVLFSELVEEEKEEGEVNIIKDVTPVDAIRKVLTRIKISDSQLEIYTTLAGGPLETGEFLRRTNSTTKTMRGVFGALGRRISHTEEIEQAGLPSDTTAMLNWFKKDDKEYIELQPHAREALLLEGLI